MGFDAVFQGTPGLVPAPSGAVALGINEATGTLYYTSPTSEGWQPASAGAATLYSGTVTVSSLTSFTVVNGVITGIVGT